MENESDTKNIEVQTFADDMAKEIEGAQGGFIKKIIHEQEANEEKKKDSSIKTKKNQIFVYVGLGLLIFSIAAIVFLFLNAKKIVTLDVVPQYTPILFSDKNVFLPIDELDKDRISTTIASEVSAANVKIDGVEAIYLTINKKVVGFREFIKLIKANFLIKDNIFFENDFLIGAVKNETEPALSVGGNLFILMKVHSIPDVFLDMKNWENKMFSDLHNLWNIPITPDNAYLFTKDFEDGIVQNKNARILYDKEGKIVLMYVFIADDSIVITNTEKTIKEVILRLASSKLKK